MRTYPLPYYSLSLSLFLSRSLYLSSFNTHTHTYTHRQLDLWGQEGAIAKIGKTIRMMSTKKNRHGSSEADEIK